MIAKVFDIDESCQYDNLNNEMFESFSSNPQTIQDDPKLSKCHDNKKIFNPETHVKVRLLCPFKLEFNFDTPVPQNSSFVIDKAIIHFHGGGFVCQDSFAH